MQYPQYPQYPPMQSMQSMQPMQPMQQMQQMQQMQPMQPQYNSPTPEQLLLEQQKWEQKKQEMTNNYNKIGITLHELLSNEHIKTYTDHYKLFENLSSPNPIPREKMPDFFKHLLQYTYLATASEIKNHEEINMQLADIRASLLKLTKSDTTAT